MAKSGTVHIQRDYEDTLGCNFSVDETLNISEGQSNNYLKLDLSGSGIVLDGFGNVPNESVQVTGDCGESDTLSVGGVYFIAEDTAVTGSTIQGGYNDGATIPTIPTIIEWTLTRNQ